MDRFGTRFVQVRPRVVAFGVVDAGAGAHSLGETGIDDAGVTCGVRVHQRAGDHPRDDFGIRMMVGIESMSG
ncbi:Uncharacterised protein [Mycobacteroides abscessus subsp. abscessus]|nr:Uncharacterised protein [Mycobacteroides abscessus subsp. abscessus]